MPSAQEFAAARRLEAFGSPATVVSAGPITLPAPGRGEDLQCRVSAPMVGRDRPVIVFCHGFGSSMDGYAPSQITGPRAASW